MIGLCNNNEYAPPVILIDDSYVNTHGTFYDQSGSHSTSANMYGSYGGFQFNGRNTSGSNYFGIRWECSFNFDNLNYLFFRYMGYIHGNLAVKITDSSGTIITSLTKVYGSYTLGQWQTATMNITNVTGVNTLTFGGGYSDSTGNTSSYTRYAEVLLYHDPANLVGKYTI